MKRKQRPTVLKTLVTLFSFFLFVQLQAQDGTECPYFNIEADSPDGISLALLSTNVDAVVSGVVASVIVEQTYYNAGDSIIDATYVFPMSTNAAIYAMEMQVNDRLITAVIKEKEEAQTIFEEATEAGHTASLLEQHRPNVFQMSLTNIESEDTIRVRMTYTELLVPRDGIYQFVFPTIVGPRYTTGGEPWVTQSTLEAPAVEDTEFNMNLKINAGMPVLAECKSHNVNFDNIGTTTEVSLNGSPGADFIVDYSLSRSEIQTGLLLYEGEEENFFLSIAQPPRPDVDFDSPPREYIFIMDVSGSMNGTPLEISKEMIIELLNNLDYDDKFNILFFAAGNSALADNSLPVTNENINIAIDMLEGFNGSGSTNLLPALNRALYMTGTEDFARTFVILTDGFVTVEKDAYNLIRENLNEANFFSFGIGSNVNREIIEGLAYVGEGESFVATDFLDVEMFADDFKRYIEKPALTNIQTTFTGVEVYDVEPLGVPDVFAERPIITYGKYRNDVNGKITLTGDHANGVTETSFNFADFKEDADENIAIQYLWARKKIKLMSDYGIADNPNDTLSIKEEITQLGLKYSLVTEYTSFVAVDSLIVVGEEEEEEDNGTISALEDIFETDESRKSVIEVLGIVTEHDPTLRLRIEDFDVSLYDKLMLRIVDLNGRTLQLHELDKFDAGQLIELILRNLTAGNYFVSLEADGKLVDTEKFIFIR